MTCFAPSLRATASQPNPMPNSSCTNIPKSSPDRAGPLRVGFIGCGAIARVAIERLASDPAFEIASIVTTRAGQASAAQYAASLGIAPRVGTRVVVSGLEVLVEAAGHAALRQHVVPALRSGTPCIVSSVGALCDPRVMEEVDSAAVAGDAHLELVSGAIGALDILGAAREGGLHWVLYVGRKPALAWLGTPAERVFDLRGLDSRTVIFEGSAREAASCFPRNANVAAAVGFAGLGLDATRVQLVADPNATGNTHHLEAEGTFGSFRLWMSNAASPANSKTSLLAGYSVVRALRRRLPAGVPT